MGTAAGGSLAAVIAGTGRRFTEHQVAPGFMGLVGTTTLARSRARHCRDLLDQERDRVRSNGPVLVRIGMAVEESGAEARTNGVCGRDSRRNLLGSGFLHSTGLRRTAQ